MLPLSGASFAAMMLNCEREEDRCGAVVFGNRRELIEFVDGLIQIHQTDKIPGVYRIYKSYRGDTSSILFKNGSRVDLIPLAPDSIQGRYHEVLCSASVDAKYPPIQHALQRMLIAGIPHEEDMADDPLDDFLESFHIIDGAEG